MLQLDLAVFLKQSRINAAEWQSSNISWDELLLIGEDHEKQRPAWEATATLQASLIQRFDAVHSVRWRVKDAYHLMAKIVRKRAKNTQKYMDISVANYADIVDDLLGLRILHLFKEDCFDIDRAVRIAFDLKETPIAYVRDGDNAELIKKYEDAGMVVKKHLDNYRSIHYILTTKPTVRVVNTELQVRTIFEEGWSEIDHKVRYPNFLNDPQLNYILGILNGMAGQADETGAFIQKLAQVLHEAKVENQEQGRIRNERIEKIELALDSAAREQPIRQAVDVDLARTELAKLKEDSARNDIDGMVAHVAEESNGHSSESGMSVGQQPTIMTNPSDAFSPTKKAIESQYAALSMTGAADQFSSIAVVQKAFEDQNAAMSAIKSIDQLAALGVSKRAMDEQSAVSKAIKDFDKVGAVVRAMDEQSAALKAIKDFDKVGAVARAMEEQSAVSKAIKDFDKVGAVVRAMDEQSAVSKAIKDFDKVGAVARAMEEQSAVSKAIKDFDKVGAVVRAMDEQSAALKARQAVEQHSALDAAMKAAKPPFS